MSEWASFSRDLIDQWPLIANGLGQTLLLAALMSITGLLGGIVVLYLTLSPNALVRRLTQGYISFFIGMPLIVLLFLMYYGLPQWGVKISGRRFSTTSRTRSPWFTSIMGPGTLPLKPHASQTRAGPMPDDGTNSVRTGSATM